MDQFQRIDALLELEVLIGELGLVVGLAQLLPDHLLRAGGKRREVRTVGHSNLRIIAMSAGGLAQLASMRHDSRSSQITWGRRRGAVSPEVLPKSLDAIHGERDVANCREDVF